MKPPTTRQLFLMQFAGPPHSFWRVSQYGRSNIIRAYEYSRTASERDASARELDALKAAGWIELRPDEDHDTRDTRTNEVTNRAFRVWLTIAGQKVSR